MKKTLITRSQFVVMPWRNGAGVTAQIAIEPADCDFSNMDFEWRLSSARIQDGNTFSQFPGYDRLLTVVSGEGLLINNHELGPFDVVEFQGEDKVECSVIDEPVEDLGIIFKRDKYLCSMQLLDVTAPMYLKMDEGTHFFLSLSEQAIVDGTDLNSPDFLRVEGAESVEITARKYPAHILKIKIIKK